MKSAAETLDFLDAMIDSYVARRFKLRDARVHGNGPPQPGPRP